MTKKNEWMIWLILFWCSAPHSALFQYFSYIMVTWNTYTRINLKKKKIFQNKVLCILMHTGCLCTLNKERKKKKTISKGRLCDTHVNHKWPSKHEVWMNLLTHKLSMALFAQAVHDIKIWLHFLVNIFFSHLLCCH